MSRPTAVLTLGRLPVGLDIARSLAARGWRVVVAEPFGMHLCRMSNAVHHSVRVVAPDREPERYLDQLADVILRERAELVVPVSEESTRVAELRSRLPASVRVFADTPDNMLALHDKQRFSMAAVEAGLPVPDSYPIDDLPEKAPRELVVKPRFSCSGRGVRKLAAGDPVRADAGDIVQHRIRGDEFSGFCMSREGGIVAPVVYRSVVTSGSVGVCFERVTEASAIVDWMRRFAASRRHTGFLAFDFILDQAGMAYAIECNPRATSGIHFVRPAALAAFLLDEDIDSDPVRADTLLTESWSCFTACLARLTRPAACRDSFSRLIRARDVTWSWRDPWPFILMPINTYRIIRDALLTGSTFAEVAVRDVEWRAHSDAETGT